MNSIIAVVPNICEGRDEAFIEKLSATLAAVPNLLMLDVSVDRVRNRTVFSFTGTKEAVFTGVSCCTKRRSSTSTCASTRGSTRG